MNHGKGTNQEEKSEGRPPILQCEDNHKSRGDNAAGDSLDLPRLNQLAVSIKGKVNVIKSLDSDVKALVSEEDLEDEIAQSDNYKE